MSDRKILASVNRRYLGSKCIEFTVSLFGNFPITDAVFPLQAIPGVDKVVDHETSYHLEVVADLKFFREYDMKHKEDTPEHYLLAALNQAIKTKYNIDPTYAY